MEDTLIQLLQHPIIVNALGHIEVLNGEVGQVQIDVAILKTQMATVLKLQWAVLLGIGGIITFVIGKAIALKINGKK